MMVSQNVLEQDADAYNAVFSSSVDLGGSYVRNNVLTGKQLAPRISSVLISVNKMHWSA